jgi:3D (Asp-Asp-Asp) domain-containing protein
MKTPLSGSAISAAALLSSLFFLAARPSVAETPVLQPQETTQRESKKQNPVVNAMPRDSVKTVPETAGGKTIEPVKVADIAVSEPLSYVATAYSLRGRTASGKFVSQGIIAADPKFLPLGSRVHVQAGAWSGEYLVADTGGAIKGRKIDIWTPSTREAMKFGRRTVKLTVLSYGGKRATGRKRMQI